MDKGAVGIDIANHEWRGVVLIALDIGLNEEAPASLIEVVLAGLACAKCDCDPMNLSALWRR
jgi:hypothetical protein